MEQLIYKSARKSFLGLFVLLCTASLFISVERKNRIDVIAHNAKLCNVDALLILDADSFKTFQRLSKSIDDNQYQEVSSYLTRILAELDSVHLAQIYLNDSIIQLCAFHNICVADNSKRYFYLDKVKHGIGSILHKIRKGKTLSATRKNELKRYLLYWVASVIGRKLWYFNPQIEFSCDIEDKSANFHAFYKELYEFSDGVERDSIMERLNWYAPHEFATDATVIQKKFARKYLHGWKSKPNKDLWIAYQEKLLKSILLNVRSGKWVLYNISWGAIP